MAELIDFSACIVSGGASLAKRIEALRPAYSALCAEYFDGLLQKHGTAFEESASGFLLLDGLFLKNGVSRSDLVISRGDDGRPDVINRNGVDFSISHSEGAAMCVLALGPDISVGADIQHVRGYSKEKMIELADTFMGSDDYMRFLKTADEELFYTLWTRREAYIKRVGADVFADTRDIKLDTDNFRTGVISACGERYYYSICIG